jgi:hypothetical protein
MFFAVQKGLASANGSRFLYGYFFEALLQKKEMKRLPSVSRWRRYFLRCKKDWRLLTAAAFL